MNELEYKPTIPAMVRTVVYVTGLAVGFVSLLASGLAVVWFPEYSAQVNATGVTVTAAVGWLAAALGVAYRPTQYAAGEVVEADVPPEDDAGM